MQMNTDRRGLWVLVGLVSALVVGLAVLAGQRVATADVRDDRKVTYVIPAGTEAIIRAGGDPQIVPSVMRFLLGARDVLVIVNEDAVGHTFGPYFVAAGDTVEVQFFRAATYEGYCSVHPSGQLTIEVQGPWWRLW